ncbi:MAG: hypothetical protein ACQERM_04405 [Methanobacteriota archaeon]
MCHHYDEARTWTEIQARHRSEEADERADETPDVDAVDEPVVDEPVVDEPVVDEPAGETEESEPPAEPRAPADD